MTAAAREVATEAGWRLQTLLRSRRFFSQAELLHLYKAQVLSFIESSLPGYYHAAASTLEPIDRVQRRLLRELNLPELDALRFHKPVKVGLGGVNGKIWINYFQTNEAWFLIIFVGNVET